MILKTIILGTATTTVAMGWNLGATTTRTSSPHNIAIQRLGTATTTRRCDNTFIKTCSATRQHDVKKSIGVLWATSITTTDESSSSSFSSSSPFQPTPNNNNNTSPPEHVLSTPLPLHTFAGQVEQGMKDRFGQENIQRILQSWRLLDYGYEHRAFVGNDLAVAGSSDENNENDDEISRIKDPETSLCHQHAVSYVPGLSIREFWNTNDYDWCRRLVQSYPAIRKEFDTVMASPNTLQEQGNNIWAGALTQDAGSYGIGWRTLVLMDRGRWDPINVNLFPVTAQAIVNSQAPAVEVFFASMQPDSQIKPHSDFTNFVLTSHLALDIPHSGENKCRIRVGDTTRQWMNGNIMLFDTSILHDAVNESPNLTRYILMLRVWHPDLTEMECQALQFTYDCLEEPLLVLPTATPEQRFLAEQKVQALRVFPKIQVKRKPTATKTRRSSVATTAAAGFGSSSSVGKSSSKNQKQRKSGKK